MAPPLPARSDAEFDTCPHAYPIEECVGDGVHLTLEDQRTARRTRRRDVALAR
jgi:hypothetical protein